ncbi:MAG TPA: hypothetical protein DDY39_14525 [Nitrospira sp.]|nr:hypothetical protein [Nitrospira sp.]HBR51147.1 hypothetical protein [Nitrospira sp.]
MSKIFLSYRREDSADVTGRIDDRLVQQFGREAVFVYVDSIPFGVDFRKHLDDQVAKCDVFLAVIGPDWTGTKDGKGKSRLEDPRDFVRIEIESALKREIPIIPVFVRGAKFPATERLPTNVHDLSYRNGLEVRSGHDFHKDMNRLIEFLKQQVRGFSETQLERSTSSKPVLNETKPVTPTAPVDMLKVPKGPFLYGEKRARAVIEHDYWIDQYPVTNEKYRAFVLAGGYEKRQYWSDEGWTGKRERTLQGLNIGMIPYGTSSTIRLLVCVTMKRKPMRNGPASVFLPSRNGKRRREVKMGVSIPGAMNSTQRDVTVMSPVLAIPLQ